MASKKPLNNAARRRQMVIAGGVLLLFVGAFLIVMQLAGPQEGPVRTKPKKPDVTRLASPGTQATTGPSYESALDSRMSALQSLVEQTEVNAERRQKEAVAEALARQQKPLETPERQASLNNNLPPTPLKIFDNSKLGQSLPTASDRSPPVPAQPTSSLVTLRFAKQPSQLGGSDDGGASRSGGAPYSILTPSAESQEAYRGVGRALRGEALASESGSAAHVAQNTETYLPSGTFFQVTNLNGLDAPTGGQAQNNPVPMLLNVTSMGQLPNKFKTDVKQCFITAQGWGDLSAERAYIRTESLSCVRRNGDVIDIPIQGYVVGGDGKVGLRGRVVSKQGQVLANALWVSMLSSFGEVSKAAATTVNVSSAGAISAATGSQSTSDLLRQGALSGLGEAAKTLSNYYISLAEKLWPVIEVDPGQGAEIVLSRGASLLQQPGGNERTGLASISDQVQNTASKAFGGLQGLSTISPTFNLNFGTSK
jgi:conjugal transfer pilus assembly protein TraB